MTNRSLLEQNRQDYAPKLPLVLHNLHSLAVIEVAPAVDLPGENIAARFPLTGRQPFVRFEKGESQPPQGPLRIGVVLSGGQAAGGHNVIAGLFDALASKYPGSELIGFLGGPSGILDNKWKVLDKTTIAPYRNTGGFDMIGSGRTKIEAPEQFTLARETVASLRLDGLVVVGGDDSNTNAAHLAEDFKAYGVDCCVVGIPKTIDGDLKNQWIEVSFGFDTASKTYSETIGDIARDALSAAKYYHFIKLMGRSASHVTLECALQTQPNVALISEEVEAFGRSLDDLVHEIADAVCLRAEHGKNYGVVLVPEGILEFIPECKLLIRELNALLAKENDILGKCAVLKSDEERISLLEAVLTPMAQKCFRSLPKEIKCQLILDRDPHGNVQVSKIETERLFIEMVKSELDKRKKAGDYKGKFASQPHFCGYEGRSCFPSNFDANYCYSLGHAAALLVGEELSGYMACVQRLAAPAEEWAVGGIPLAGMMHEELRKGKTVAVIRKSLVDLQGRAFQSFCHKRGDWVLQDAYIYPGPIQFNGPANLTDQITNTLALESSQLVI